MSHSNPKKKCTYVPPTYFSLADVAVILRVSMQTVRRWIKEGKLPATKIGGENSRIIRVRREDLDAFIRNDPRPPVNRR
jgi:excisionase family DNA binding protein